MGRGKYPRINTTPTIVQTVQSDLKNLEVRGISAAASGQASTRRCWTFGLQDATGIVESIAIGTKVTGVPVNSRIMIVCNLGSLGYAPQKAASAMQTAIASATLEGEVLSNSRVKLCIS